MDIIREIAVRTKLGLKTLVTETLEIAVNVLPTAISRISNDRSQSLNRRRGRATIYERTIY